jgi:hypothetical protein
VKQTLAASIVLVFLIYSCREEVPGEVDRQAPEIEIFSPERNIIYQPGDTVAIHTLFSDNTLLKRGSIHIHDQSLPSPGDTVFSYEFSIGKMYFELDTFWIVNDLTDKSYIIYIDGEDVAENYVQKLRYFHQYHQ